VTAARLPQLVSVIWAELQDANGIRKVRPTVVVSPTPDIVAGKPVHVLAVTTRLPDPLPDDHDLLPWDRQGAVRSAPQMCRGHQLAGDNHRRSRDAGRRHPATPGDRRDTRQDRRRHAAKARCERRRVERFGEYSARLSARAGALNNNPLPPTWGGAVACHHQRTPSAVRAAVQRHRGGRRQSTSWAIARHLAPGLRDGYRPRVWCVCVSDGVKSCAA